MTLRQFILFTLKRHGLIIFALLGTPMFAQENHATQPLAKNLVELIAVGMSAVALIGSALAFLLNRSYTNRVFKMTQFPELDLWYAVGTRRQASADRGEEHFADIWPDDTVLYLEWRNKTKVDALNIEFVVTLTRSFRYIRWPLSKEGWNICRAQESCKDTFKLNEAIAGLASGSLQFVSEKVDKPWEYEEHLTCGHDGDNADRFGILIEMRWTAPLWQSKVLRRRYAATMRPIIEDGIVDGWTMRPKCLFLPFCLYAWRPKRIHCDIPLF